MEEIKTMEQKFDEYFLESTRKRFGRMRFEVDVDLLRDDLKFFLQSEIDLAVSKERERILEVIKSAKAYVVKIPEIDPSFGDLIDADLNFIEHKEGNVLFRHELINLINTK